MVGLGTRRLRLALALALVAGVTAALAASHMDAAFDLSNHGDNGAIYSLAARNYLRYDTADFLYAMCVQPGPVVERPAVYVNHPPMTAWLIAASFSVFGEGEAQARVAQLVMTVLAAVVSVLFLRRVFAGSCFVGAVGALLMAGTPMFAYYGNMPDPQGSGVILSVAGALWCCARWSEQGRRRDLVGAHAFLLFGYLVDWPVLAAACCLAVWALWAKRRRGVAAALSFAASAVVASIALAAWIHAIAAQGNVTSSSLFANLLHHAGIALHAGGDRPPLSELVGRLLDHHLDGFGPALGPVGFAAALWLVLALARRRAPGRYGLLLVFTAVGICYVAAFPVGAHVHDYWQIYLAPGLAFPACFALARGLEAGGRLAAATRGLALAGAAATCALGFAASRARWSEHAELDAMRRIGRHIAASTAEREWIGATLGNVWAVSYYADRRFKADLASLTDPDELRVGWIHVAETAGGFLLTAREQPRYRAFLDAARMRGPVAFGEYRFWDQHPVR